MKPSARPVSSTSAPALSIAARAAFMRSTAKRNVVERLLLVAGRVLDREPGDTGRAAARDVRGDALRIVRIAAFEIRVHRHVGRRDDLGEMREHLSTPTALSACATAHAKPDDVEASALKPSPCR